MKTSISLRKAAFVVLTTLLTLTAPAQDAASWARTFTSSDGRQLKAIPVSKNDTSVTVRKPEGGPPLVLPLAGLSAADQAFVKAWTPPANAAPVAAKPGAAPTGSVAGKLVIVPINADAAINPLGAGAFDKEPLKDSHFVDVSAIDHHVVAVTADGKAVCFGMDQNGKPMVDVLPKTKRKIVACTAAQRIDYLMDADGRIEPMRIEPFQTMNSRTKARRIFVVGRHEVAFALGPEGRLEFIGHPNDKKDFDFPPALKDTAFQTVNVHGHIVGITTEGKLHIWGKTGGGQLPLPPELTGSDIKVSAVGIHGNTTIAVRDDGKIVTWGEGAKRWNSKLGSAPGTLDAWDLSDGYWATTIFRQESAAGTKYSILSNSTERDAYLQKVLDQYKPVKITQTKDAIIMITSAP